MYNDKKLPFVDNPKALVKKSQYEDVRKENTSKNYQEIFIFSTKKTTL
jgi:hypothetical protein